MSPVRLSLILALAAVAAVVDMLILCFCLAIVFLPLLIAGWLLGHLTVWVFGW
jgi:hypothetical protein